MLKNTSFFLFLAFLFLFSVFSASAATITVNTLTDENNTNATACSLREAINNANGDNTANGLGCAAGSGADSIVISVNGTITLTSALPNIGPSLDITGNGANVLTVAGNGTFRLMNMGGVAGANYNLSGFSMTGGFVSAGANAGVIEFNDAGTLTLSRMEFYANNHNGGNALFYSNAATLFNIVNSTFRNNIINKIFDLGSTPFTVTSSTFSDNTAIGFYISNGISSTSTITSSTFMNNVGVVRHTSNVSGQVVVIRNTLAYQNGLAFRDGNCALNNFQTGGFNYNDDSSGSSLCNTNATDQFNTGVNPGLLALDYYGGTVRTRSLRAGSPAIDKGNSFGQATDQRGLARPVDLASITNAAGGNGADIGAYESQLAPTAAGVSISGRVTANGKGLANARVELTGTGGVAQTVTTNAFGNFTIEAESGATYVINVSAKKYTFAPQVVSVTDSISDLVFTAQ